MKNTLVAGIVALLVGLGIGWFLGQRYELKKIQDEAERFGKSFHNMMQSEGPSVVQAVRCIQSGNNQRAVELLAGRVADYYIWYEKRWKANSAISKTAMSEVQEYMAQIEQLAKTNAVISNAIYAAKHRPRYE